MKIFRFTCHSNIGPLAYGYIKANFIERFFINKRIKNGDKKIRHVTWQPGPKSYGAQYIIKPRACR